VRPRRRGAALLAAALGAGAPAAASPAQDYVLHCQGCHLADGRGAPGRVPSLAGPPGRLAGVAGGRAYLARVPGVAQAPLSDDRVAALLDWVLRAFSAHTLPPDFPPYTAAEVAAARRAPLLDPAAARAALLEALATADRRAD
jgi:mono/diheme cytochrome c family protein